MEDICRFFNHHSICSQLTTTARERVGHGAHKKVLEIQLKVLRPELPHVAVLYGNSGCVYVRQEKYEEALKAIRKALEMQLKVLGLEHPTVAVSYIGLGNVYLGQGRHKEAMEPGGV